MQQNRRRFLQQSLKAGALISGLNAPFIFSACSPEEQVEEENIQALNILILGGTSFLGPQQIAYALGRGHKISTFTRGRTKPSVHAELFSQVESLIGDREDNLKALEGRKWDAVIDNSGRRVQWTRDTAELLKDHVDLYLYTSSTGVYYPYLGQDIDEDTELLTVVPEGVEGEEKLEYDYGVMKTNSELAAQAGFGTERTIVVRPTYMMGPGDRTDRFTYWPVRLSKGGDVLVPGKAEDPVQYIDVRDVAQWMIRLIEQKVTGAFNAVGPAQPTGMRSFVEEAQSAFESKANFVQVDDYDFLLEQGVPYSVPWIMPTENNAGSSLINFDRAIANGLTYTPLIQSVKDIHQWWYSDAVTEERRNKLENGEDSLMAREADILEAWRILQS